MINKLNTPEVLTVLTLGIFWFTLIGLIPFWLGLLLLVSPSVINVAIVYLKLKRGKSNA